METFEVLGNFQPQSLNQAFGALNQSACKYIEKELDLCALAQHFGGINKQYISLKHFSLNPGVALKRIGCTNVDQLLSDSEYTCGFMNMNRYSILPLGIVVNGCIAGLRKYHFAFENYAKDGTSPAVLHLLPDYQRFDKYAWGELEGIPEDVSTNYEVNRFEQLFAGSGFTLEMLANHQKDMNFKPVLLSLSNGDSLLAYAYKKCSL